MVAILTLDGKEVAVLLLEVVQGMRHGARCKMPDGRIEMHLTSNVKVA